MPKRNREKLMEQSLCDMLCTMNENLRTNKTFAPCIMTALGEKVRMARCLEHKADCEKCLQSWLNECPF